MVAPSTAHPESDLLPTTAELSGIGSRRKTAYQREVDMEVMCKHCVAVIKESDTTCPHCGEGQ